MVCPDQLPLLGQMTVLPKWREVMMRVTVRVRELVTKEMVTMEAVIKEARGMVPMKHHR